VWLTAGSREHPTVSIAPTKCPSMINCQPESETPSPATAKPDTVPAVTVKSESIERAQSTEDPQRTGAALAAKEARAGVSKPSYWIQIGAFRNSLNAERLVKAVRAEGFLVQVATVTRQERLYLVRVSGFLDRSRSTLLRQDLRERGYPGFLTEGPAK